jgi:hypothetical protein
MPSSFDRQVQPSGHVIAGVAVIVGVPAGRLKQYFARGVAAVVTGW